MMKAVAGFLRRHRATNWALADQSMVSGANFLTGIVLARGLGIAGFGRFSLAWLVVLFVQSLQDNSIALPMMSIGPKQDEQQRPRYYGGVFFQQAIFAGLSTVLTWACLRFAGKIVSDQNMAPLAVSLAAAVLLCQAQEFLRRYFFVVQNPAVSFASDAVRYASQLAILLWVFFVSKGAHDVNVALWVIAGAAAAGALVLLVFVDKLEWTTSALRQAVLRNWRSASWLVGAALGQWMSGNLFVVSAGALLGVTAVGALKAAQSLMGVTHILFQGLDNVVPIRAAQRYHAGGPADLVHYLAKVTKVGLVATACVGLLFVFDPAFWFGLLFGKEFTQYSYLLRWYAAVYLLMFSTLPLRIGLRAIERTGPIFLAYIVGAIFSVAAAYPLVRGLGLIGVMLGLMGIQLLQLGVLLISFRQAVDLTPYLRVIPPQLGRPSPDGIGGP
jgi:O-antigen/teichoic acid export membrane protein